MNIVREKMPEFDTLLSECLPGAVVQMEFKYPDKNNYYLILGHDNNLFGQSCTGVFDLWNDEIIVFNEYTKCAVVEAELRVKE